MNRCTGRAGRATVLLLGVALACFQPLGAQDVPAASDTSISAQLEATDGQAQARPGGALTQGSSGLPAVRSESMRDYWHVFLAYGAAWLLLFGYVVSVGRRFGQLEEEVRRLSESS